MEALWKSCSCSMYSLEDRQKQLGLGDKVGTRIADRRLEASCERFSSGRIEKTFR